MLNITRSGKITSWSHAIQVIATGILSGLLVMVNYDCLQTYITPFCVTFNCPIRCVCKQYESHCPVVIRIWEVPLGGHFGGLGSNTSFWEDTSIPTILLSGMQKMRKDNKRFYRIIIDKIYDVWHVLAWRNYNQFSSEDISVLHFWEACINHNPFGTSAMKFWHEALCFPLHLCNSAESRMKCFSHLTLTEVRL